MHYDLTDNILPLHKREPSLANKSYIVTICTHKTPYYYLIQKVIFFSKNNVHGFKKFILRAGSKPEISRQRLNTLFLNVQEKLTASRDFWSIRKVGKIRLRLLFEVSYKKDIRTSSLIYLLTLSFQQDIFQQDIFIQRIPKSKMYRKMYQKCPKYRAHIDLNSN